MIRQIFPTRNGIGVLVNDEVRDFSGSNQSTFDMMVNCLESFFSQRNEEMDTSHCEHVTSPREKWHFRVHDHGAHHGYVDVVYYGQQEIKDTSVNPSYFFTAERFAAYFNAGTKQMSEEERKDFLEYIRKEMSY